MPVPSEVPPVDAPYQFTVPVDGVAPSVAVPVPHIELGVVPVIVGMAFIVALMVVLLDDMQPLLWAYK